MSSRFHEYLELTKPRVVALLVFCAVIGMFLAVPGIPPWRALVFGTLGHLDGIRFGGRVQSPDRSNASTS